MTLTLGVAFQSNPAILRMYRGNRVVDYTEMLPASDNKRSYMLTHIVVVVVVAGTWVDPICNLKKIDG